MTSIFPALHVDSSSSHNSKRARLQERHFSSDQVVRVSSSVEHDDATMDMPVSPSCLHAQEALGNDGAEHQDNKNSADTTELSWWKRPPRPKTTQLPLPGSDWASCFVCQRPYKTSSNRQHGRHDRHSAAGSSSSSSRSKGGVPTNALLAYLRPRTSGTFPTLRTSTGVTTNAPPLFSSTTDASCGYCERTNVCLECLRECSLCHDLFCSLCATLDYGTRGFTRILCPGCHGQATTDPQEHGNAMDMDDSS